MGGLLEIYNEPLFWQFPVASAAISAFAFLLFALPMTWLAAKDPDWAAPYKIQSRRARQQELFGASMKTWVVNNAILFPVVMLGWPLLRHSGVHAGPLPPWYVIVGQLVFFIYLDDFLYYWFHRSMHSRWAYKKIHSWHHRILTPWAVTGVYMHPVEYVLTATVALVGPIALGSHVVVLWIWFTFRQWEAAEGHCGYEFSWTPTHLLPFNDGARHHDFHHAKVKGNYAGFLTLWDYLFGTYSRDYTPERWPKLA